MNAFAKLANVLAVPLTLINRLGWIVGGIWLAVLSEWISITYGIALLASGAFGLGIAMMLGLLLDAPGVVSYKKGNKVAFHIFGFLSAMYTNAVLTVWCIAILYFFVKQADGSSIIPMLLWSYGVATTPIEWLAQKDLQSGNAYAMISTFFAKAAYLLVILAVLFTRVSVVDVLVLFGIVMFADLIIQLRIAFQEEKAMTFME